MKGKAEMGIIERLDSQINDFYSEHRKDLHSIELSLEEWQQLQEETKDMMIVDGNNREVFGDAMGRWRNTSLYVHYPKGEKLI